MLFMLSVETLGEFYELNLFSATECSRPLEYIDP